MLNTITGDVEKGGPSPLESTGASIEHAVALVDDHGVEVQRRSVQHDAAGLRRLIRLLAAAGVVDVAIERADGPLVDALLEGGFTVFVIPPATCPARGDRPIP